MYIKYQQPAQQVTVNSLVIDIGDDTNMKSL